MKPPGDIPWEESAAAIGDSKRTTFLMKCADVELARKFVGEYWSWAYSSRSALFVSYPPKLQARPAAFTAEGLAAPTPPPPMPEIWFVPQIMFAEAWGFARVKGFTSAEGPSSVVEACDAFLLELATRQPIGVDAVGEGWASFRRYADGGAFDLPDMRRAWELNMALLGGRQDTLHLDPRIPRQFVRDSSFYFGL